MVYELNETGTMPAVQKCICGLTAYAVKFAAAGQDDKLPWLYTLTEDMTEFWGLKSPDQYLTAFKRAVLEARSSRQAAVLSEEIKDEILSGLSQYIGEMRANHEEQEPWFIECDGFMRELREQ